MSLNLYTYKFKPDCYRYKYIHHSNHKPKTYTKYAKYCIKRKEPNHTKENPKSKRKTSREKERDREEQ